MPLGCDLLQDVGGSTSSSPACSTPPGTLAGCAGNWGTAIRRRLCTMEHTEATERRLRDFSRRDAGTLRWIREGTNLAREESKARAAMHVSAFPPLRPCVSARAPLGSGRIFLIPSLTPCTARGCDREAVSVFVLIFRGKSVIIYLTNAGRTHARARDTSDGPRATGHGSGGRAWQSDAVGTVCMGRGRRIGGFGLRWRSGLGC